MDEVIPLATMVLIALVVAITVWIGVIAAA